MGRSRGEQISVDHRSMSAQRDAASIHCKAVDQFNTFSLEAKCGACLGLTTDMIADFNASNVRHQC